MRYLISATILLITLILSCKEGGKTTTTSTETKTKPPAPIAAPRSVPESALTPTGTTELMNMITNYYSLKDALVATDGKKADEAASKLMSAAEIFLAEHVSGDKNPNLRPDVQIVMKKSEKITTSKPEDIEEKRTQFSDISEALFKVIIASKLHHAGVYHEFCPMAFDNKGAYWLSAESEIKNPYFGKKMLECGEVKDSF